MNKKSMTEQEIRSEFIRPAIVAAGWQGPEVRLREEYYFDDGRMNIQGKTAVRGHCNNGYFSIDGQRLIWSEAQPVLRDEKHVGQPL